VERLLKVAKKRDRSPNYLVVEAILRYLDREEK
jgi:predicted transcriptional regulator